MHISSLCYYPVKSLAPLTTDRLVINSWGPNLDRRMMLVDSEGKFITQRQIPKMTLCGVEDFGTYVQFSFNDETFRLDWPDLNNHKGDDHQVRIWTDTVIGMSFSVEANEWFSRIFKKALTLVYMPESEVRQVDLEFSKVGDKTGFADGFPFLLISEASVKDLQSRVGCAIELDRFRPNIVVSGCDAFEEDGWKKITIGDIEFDVVKACSRCVIPTINPVTAQKQPEVMKELQSYRRQGSKVFFGQNLIHRGVGHISVGDTVKGYA